MTHTPPRLYPSALGELMDVDYGEYSEYQNNERRDNQSCLQLDDFLSPKVRNGITRDIMDLSHGKPAPPTVLSRSIDRKNAKNGIVNGNKCNGFLSGFLQKQQQQLSHKRQLRVACDSASSTCSSSTVDGSDISHVTPDNSKEENTSKEDESHCENFQGVYMLTRKIFRCDRSQVWQCVERVSNEPYCVKIVSLRLLTGVASTEAARREVYMLQAARSCPQVAQLVQCTEECGRLYMVMELAPGSNVLSKVIQQNGAGLPESHVRYLAKSILQACSYLHSELQICHNDLQPSNIIASEREVKLCDFGSALPMDYDASSGLAHMPNKNGVYTAPEVWNGLAYNTPESDCWTIGVVIFFMLYGRTPFGVSGGPINKCSNSQRSVLVSRMTRSTSFRFPPPDWNVGTDVAPAFVSRHAKQVISGLLHRDPAVRLTATEALQHPWLAELVKEDLEEEEATSSKKKKKKGYRGFVPTGNGLVKRVLLRDSSHCSDFASNMNTLSLTSTSGLSSGRTSKGLSPKRLSVLSEDMELSIVCKSHM